jgi:hypothetical protein
VASSHEKKWNPRVSVDGSHFNKNITLSCGMVAETTFRQLVDKHGFPKNDPDQAAF